MLVKGKTCSDSAVSCVICQINPFISLLLLPEVFNSLPRSPVGTSWHFYYIPFSTVFLVLSGSSELKLFFLGSLFSIDFIFTQGLCKVCLLFRSVLSLMLHLSFLIWHLKNSRHWFLRLFSWLMLLPSSPEQHHIKSKSKIWFSSNFMFFNNTINFNTSVPYNTSGKWAQLIVRWFQLQDWETPCDICCSLWHLLLYVSSPAAILLRSLFSLCPSIPIWQSCLIWLDRPVSSTAHACVETSGIKLKRGNQARTMSEAEPEDM